MVNDLASPDDLVDLPGAPFTVAEVDAAVASVRTAAGWHIAPERTETIRMDVTSWERWLRLPTRKLVTVDAVRKTSDSAPIDASKYEISTHLAMVKRTASFWPCGYESVEVDMTHGYANTPADLLATIAQAAVTSRRDQAVREVSIDDYSTSYHRPDQMTATVRDSLADYALDNTLYGIGIA